MAAVQDAVAIWQMSRCSAIGSVRRGGRESGGGQTTLLFEADAVCVSWLCWHERIIVDFDGVDMKKSLFDSLSSSRGPCNEHMINIERTRTF